MKKIKGFTLIELLIVIAIIGILVGIALPSYQAHVRKANRIDMQFVMTEMSVAAERQYARQGSYPADSNDASGFDFYTLAFDNLDNNTPSKVGFTITASPKGSQVSDECGTMTLNHTGGTNASLAICW